MTDPGLGVSTDPRFSLLMRSRRSIAVNTKSPAGRDLVLDLIAQADGLIEGFRPGVMERLGLGPDEALKRNPALAYGRMTGWGQEGPLSQAAGHDINYIALSGVLNSIGRTGTGPVPPLNLVGDFGGGALYLAMGLLAAILETRQSGQGQVVDAAMTDGSASLTTMFYGLMAAGLWRDETGSNLLDSGAHFYDVYETEDEKYVSIGSIEGKFYAELLRLTGLEGEDLPGQMEVAKWPELRQRLAEVFKTKTRSQWSDIMEGSDVCFAPVLSMTEAPDHPHNAARSTFVDYGGVVQPGPAPRFSRTPSEIQSPPAAPGQHTEEALSDWGISAEKIATLKSAEVIG